MTSYHLGAFMSDDDAITEIVQRGFTSFLAAKTVLVQAYTAAQNNLIDAGVETRSQTLDISEYEYTVSLSWHDTDDDTDKTMLFVILKKES